MNKDKGPNTIGYDREGNPILEPHGLRSASELIEEVRRKAEEKESRRTVFRTKHDPHNPYVMLNRHSLNNKALSAKAKGILAYCLSMPDDWIFYVDELTTHFKDGEKSIRSGIAELIKARYIQKSEKRDNQNGRFGGMDYTIHEVPENNVPKANHRVTKTGIPLKADY